MRGDICRIEKCSNTVVNAGLVCNWHRYAKRKYGDYSAQRKSKKGSFHSRSRVHSFIHSRKNLFYNYVLLPNINGCMEWFGPRNKKGYGFLKWNDTVRLAHRVSYAIHYGEYDIGLCVLHKCDNPSCVAPQHLFLGTRKDNMRDCSNKNRLIVPNLSGENNASAKLKLNDVYCIREMIAKNIRIKEIAKKYNVSTDCIYSIKNKKTWGRY